MTIPLPSIETQRELVAVYNGLKELAEENERLLEPLSKSCEAFISAMNEGMPRGFGSPNGLPLKQKFKKAALFATKFLAADSNPRGNIKKIPLGELIEQCDERNSRGKLTIDDVMGISTAKEFIPTKADMGGVSLLSYKVVSENQFAYVADTSRRGEKIALAFNSLKKRILISSIYTVFSVKDTNRLLPEFLFLILSRAEFDRYARFNSWGSARETFDWAEMCRVRIPLPPIDVQQKIVDLWDCRQECKRIAATARAKIKALCPALVQKAAHSG